jgi:hypothetical protein
VMELDIAEGEASSGQMSDEQIEVLSRLHATRALVSDVLAAQPTETAGDEQGVE